MDARAALNFSLPFVVAEKLLNPPRLESTLAAEEQRLGDSGRVLVRPSGTEPLVRVMVEASDPASARESADRLVAVVERELG